MNAQERRSKLIDYLKSAASPLSGSHLAAMLGVSRQVIVQDIAILRAGDSDIVSTSQGYLLQHSGSVSRVFKVIHSDEQTEEEMNLIVDAGGRIEDVFVYHKVYGVVKAELNIRSRLDVRHFTEGIASGKSTLLKNVTSGYHYHTVTAESEALLDLIQDLLAEKSFLAPLQDFEPVDFWKSR